MEFSAVLPHQRHREPIISHGQIGRSMVPVFENRRVRILQLMQRVRMIVRYPRPKHVVVRPLEHVDWVNLDVAQMLNSPQDRCFSETKWQQILRQSLGPQHDSSDFGDRQRNWRPALDGLCEENWFGHHQTVQTCLMPPQRDYGFPPKL